jgi:hypothetical protein
VVPTDEFEFAGQLVHAALPIVGLYVPDGHIAHWPFVAPLSVPLYPALHEQRISDQQNGSSNSNTSTCRNCRYRPPPMNADNLRYRAVPTHLCLLIKFPVKLGTWPVAQFVKVTASFESCRLKVSSQ